MRRRGYTRVLCTCTMQVVRTVTSKLRVVQYVSTWATPHFPGGDYDVTCLLKWRSSRMCEGSRQRHGAVILSGRGVGLAAFKLRWVI